MTILDRVRVRLRDEPSDLLPASVRMTRFLARRAWREGTSELAGWHGGFLEHFGVHYGRNNAGDTVLFDALEDLFNHALGPQRWHRRQLRRLVQPRDVDEINRGARAVLVGGGGLLISDTNPNAESGWQWRIGLSELEHLAPPLVVFAIGYNQFRGSQAFQPIFEQHLAATVEKATFFGLRNRGSIAKTRAHLPARLADKLCFQPCMTTVLREFHPVFAVPRPRPHGKRLALNLAFDRAEKRYGQDLDRIRDQLVAAIRWASGDGWEIVLVLHAWDDDPAVKIVRAAGVPVSIKRLNLSSADEIIRFYADMPLTIGMRGHAQMIPFGCGNAILSIVSHDKLSYFLEDIEEPEWGIDVRDPALGEKLIERISAFDRNRNDVLDRVDRARGRLWAVTQDNLTTIRSLVRVERPA